MPFTFPAIDARWIALVTRGHVIAGVVALAVGLIAMLSPKGRVVHRSCGKVYVGGMAFLAVTGVVLGMDEQVPFVVYSSVFIWSLTFSGYRSLTRQGRRPRATWVDWAGLALTLVPMAGLVTSSLDASRSGNQDLAVVTGVLALMVGTLAGWDLYEFTHVPPGPKPWWFAHMAKMLGSYIAGVTAVIVIQARSLSFTQRYLLTPAILIPLVVIWMAYYKVRFRRADAARRMPAGAVRVTG